MSEDEATSLQPESRDVLNEVPQNPDELSSWLERELGLRVPRVPLMDGVGGSDAPLAYLVQTFFEGRYVLRRDGTYHDCAAEPLPGDCVVWANRGGGKTFLGAVATALDLIFKPRIEVRILGGSLEQSKRMYDHLRALFASENLAPLVNGKPTDSRLKLVNGSRVEILSASERSVRGTRVQKLRCDEADLFDPEIWQAAQLVTRTVKRPGPWGPSVRGTVEVLSTMHVPMGLMWKVTQEAERVGAWADGDRMSPPDAQRVLFKWGVVDALEHCGDEHTCDSCVLEPDCGGRAKARAADKAGHLTVLDARVMKRRVSRAAWESEMLCLRPKRTDAVFPEFEPDVHVMKPADECAPSMTLVRTREEDEDDLCTAPRLVCGMDFGVRAPTVILWAVIGLDGVVRVVDEYVETGRTIGQHIAAIDSSAWGRPLWMGVDPAGHARNDQTGLSNIAALKKAGLIAHGKRMGLAESIELVRARLSPAIGRPSLMISARCVKLIEAMQRYHYPADRPEVDVPEKDGSDHAVDALRYLLMNLASKPIGKGRW